MGDYIDTEKVVFNEFMLFLTLYHAAVTFRIKFAFLFLKHFYICGSLVKFIIETIDVAVFGYIAFLKVFSVLGNRTNNTENWFPGYPWQEPCVPFHSSGPASGRAG